MRGFLVPFQAACFYVFNGNHAEIKFIQKLFEANFQRRVTINTKGIVIGGRIHNAQ